MRRDSLRAMAAVLAGLAATMTIAAHDAQAAWVTASHSRSGNEDHVTTFTRFDDDIGIVIGTVRANTTLKNHNAYYFPGPVQYGTPMLGVVLAYNYEEVNVSDITWSSQFNVSVPAIGSLNGYMVAWQYGTYPPWHGTYSHGCNMLPYPHQCSRGVPDWLIPTSISIKLDYSFWADSPWSPFPGTNSNSLSYAWW